MTELAFFTTSAGVRMNANCGCVSAQMTDPLACQRRDAPKAGAMRSAEPRP